MLRPDARTKIALGTAFCFSINVQEIYLCFSILVMLLVALEMLREIPEIRLLCSPDFAADTDFVAPRLPALDVLFFLESELPFFI